jgi:hypothetical protein
MDYEELKKERDEARAEVERFREALRKSEQRELEALAEGNEAVVALKNVAERQRDADLSVVFNWLRDKISSDVADEIPPLPLVTEVEP